MTIYVSTKSLGPGPCLERGGGLCLDLLDAEPIAVLVARGEDRVLHAEWVDSDRAIEAVLFQAVVENERAGEAIVTDPIQRQVTVPASLARVALTKATLEAGMANMWTAGNTHTGGVAWVDFNNDYYADLFVANGAGLNHRLYRNNGDGTFADVSLRVRKPDLQAEDAGVKFADVDNDGFSDILVVVDNADIMISDVPQDPMGGPNLLYMNRGDGIFEEQAAERGLVDPDGHRNICGALADIDRDGAVDVHLGVWALSTQPQGVLDNFDWTAMNNGDGTFRDVTAASRLGGKGQDALTCGFFDANMDGLPDLYVGHVNDIDDAPPGDNPMANDALYLARGDGTYRDATADSPGLGDDAWAAMGMDVGDIDGDGDWDLYITDRWEVQDPLPRGNPLYLNNGDGTFEDNSCDTAGVCTGYPGWPTNFADFDRDGHLDLFVGTGRAHYPDLVYINDGTGRFESHHVPELIGNNAHGGALADYDGDGDVDVFIWNLEDDSELYRNEGRDAGNWLEVRLLGVDSNRDAIGATVFASTATDEMMRRVSGGDSAHSQSEQILHFGLGSAARVDLRVVWPSGAHQEFAEVQVNGLVLISERGGLLDEEATYSATWSSIVEELQIVATSNYGGRTQFEVLGFGGLSYDAETVSFSGTFGQVGTHPITVDVVDRFGRVMSVPVAQIE